MTYRVAIVGCGKRAKQHVPGLLADARCEVVAVADLKREAAQAMRDNFSSSPAIYDDYRALLTQEKIDLVVTCLWTSLHLPVLRDCVDAGVRAVHSEKPMAPTWGDCLTMKDLAERSGTQLTFCHQRRFQPGNRAVRRMIADGLFGKLLRMDLYSPPHLLDCGTHTFDQAMSFMNETPARWVLGAIDTSETISYFDIPAECMAAGMVHFDNGVRAGFQVGRTDMDMPNGVRVVGEKGFIEVAWDGEFSAAAIYDDPGWSPPAIEPSQEAAITAMVRHVVDCMASGEVSDIDMGKALRASEIIFGLYESVRSRRRVDLPIETRDNPLLAMLESGPLA